MSRKELKKFSDKINSSKKYRIIGSTAIIIILLALGVFSPAFFDMHHTPPSVLSFVVAAIFSTIVAILVSETNKENEIGKHREKWLSDLKFHCADYTSNLASSFGELLKAIEDDGFKTVKEIRDSFWSEEYISVSNDLFLKSETKFNLISLYLNSSSDKNEGILYGETRMLRELDIAFAERVQHALDDNSLEKVKEVSSELQEFLLKGFLDYHAKVKRYVDGEWKTIKNGHFYYNFKRMMLMGALVYVASFYFSYTVNYYEDCFSVNDEVKSYCVLKK
ncbi:hypothetical protein [Salinicola halophilus]|uniref:hypothetical protein n=1 Tax=Salinicola halophilus TaxID=184065 RepID=UPI0013A5FDE0|nr:hypothetical protein [Salinicola halophilus]